MANEQVPENERQMVSRPPLRVAQLGELNAYVVYEHELDALNKLDEGLNQDPPEAIYLNFALFLLPTSLSFLICLLTTTIHSNRVYELFALWERDHRSYQERRNALLKERMQQIQKIKSRMSPSLPVQGEQIVPHDQP